MEYALVNIVLGDVPEDKKKKKHHGFFHYNEDGQLVSIKKL